MEERVGYKFILGKGVGHDGVIYWVADHETERKIREAYLLPEPEFERIVNLLVDSKKAEYLG